MFNAAGLPCPNARSPSDHYLHVINEDFVSGSLVAGFNICDAIVSLCSLVENLHVHEHGSCLPQAAKSLESLNSQWMSMAAAQACRKLLKA
eukprot:1151430-Pelagomonas_calceolata.AAC.2